MANYTTTGSDTFPSHHIVQVVSGSHATETAVTNTSYEQIHASLEPSLTVTGSNKVWIMFNVPCYINTAGAHHAIQLYRGSTAIGGGTWGFGSVHSNVATSLLGHIAGNYLDTPGAGSHTYKVWHLASGGTGYACINTTRATITLFEIVA